MPTGFYVDCWILVSDRNVPVDFVRGSVSVLSVMSGVAEWTCLVREYDTYGFIFICFVAFCFVFCCCFSSWFY